jgi:hypothetical protein
MKRVIYYGFGKPYSAAIISSLYRKYKWIPVSMTDVALDENNNLDEVPLDDCIISNPMRIRRAQFDYERIGPPIYIDEEILKKLSIYEGTYIDMLGVAQDATGLLYPYSDRKNYYIDVLTYWNTIIHRKKPDIIVFYTWPHTPSCYALYILAKYGHGIDILFIDFVPLLDEWLHLIQCSLEDLSYPLNLGVDSVENDNIKNKAFKSELIYDEIPKHIVLDINAFEKSTPLLNRLVNFSKNKFKLSAIKKIGSFFKGEFIDWKANIKPYDLPDSRMNRLQLFLLFEKIKYKNRKLKKYYNQQTNTPVLSEDYIYFSAPYQPEALSMMVGSEYTNILLTLSVLSSACPSGWTIYYKEHPATFFDSLRGSIKRNNWFYERLSKFKNIKMVPSDYNQFELIKNSKAVALVTGSTAWEAVIRGKPVISFAQGWYSGLKGIINVVSLQDVHDAIELIRGGCKPNANDVSQYTAIVKKVAFKFPEHYSQANFDEKRAELVADEFYKAYLKLYNNLDSTNNCNIP